MKKIRVSAVSYLNTVPFTYGIRHSEIINQIELSLDMPSVCADKLIHQEADLGLIPVGALLSLDTYHIISDYCIGAEDAVSSVMLMSQVPLKDVKTVYLDYQSRSSVLLTRILAAKFWNIEPQWLQAEPGYENTINHTDAAVIIGDRVFENRNKFAYKYDLAEEWKKFTGLPFVFAVWASTQELDKTFVYAFNEALAFGLAHKSTALDEWKKPLPDDLNALDYLQNNISYNLSNQKKKAMELFLSYARELNLENAKIEPIS